MRLCRGGDATDERVDQALDQTDAMLDRAAGVVEESGSDRAMAKFQLAMNQQTEAKKQFVDGHAKGALRLTLAARDSIRLALRLADHATDSSDSGDA